MDLGVIQAELAFLAEENFLTNAVNYAFVHFAEIKEFITQNGWSLGENNLENESEKTIGVVREKRSLGTIGLIIFWGIVAFVVYKLIVDSSVATNAAVMVGNSNLAMGLLVIFVARKLLM